MSSRPSCWRSATCTSEAPTPTGRSMRRRGTSRVRRPGRPRSCRRRRCGRSDRCTPLPSRSAARIWAGSEPVASDADLDETGRAQGEERDGVVAQRRRWQDRTDWSTAKAMSRDGSPGLTVTGGAKLPGSPGLPARIEDVAGRVDDGDIEGAVAVQVGDQRRSAADEVDHRRARRTCRRRCSAALARYRDRPGDRQVGPAVAGEIAGRDRGGNPPIHRARRVSRAGTCRRRCPGRRSSRRFHSRWHRRWPGRGCRCR